ncbi:MAG TPA: sulfatase-like hydrolase/transferase, partial [Gemmataceae bacterium]|nr:sulfatase-like hydrolase/transferase [Gemmataceae bacterium]
MIRNTRVQMLLVLALGAAAGYTAASGKLGLFQKAEAASPTGPAAVGESNDAACCCEGGTKSQLLAMADPKVKAVVAAAQEKTGKKPNIVFIMGDDVGWFQIGAYHRGIMSGKTPNLDKLASQGVIFTDYYAEASCTAGRANFITGEIPLRTGLTTVGQAGADVGIPAQACTLATALKAQGYATGQFGKNHLGDLNKFLPTVHGFDEFFGYLYHLDAMSDPYWYSFPDDQAYRDKYGPRSLVHCYATETEDATV